MGAPTMEEGTGVMDAYQYTDRLAKLIRQASGVGAGGGPRGDELTRWLTERRRDREGGLEEEDDVGALEEHVCTVLATSGITDFGARQQMVEAAAKHMQQQQRRAKKKEKQERGLRPESTRESLVPSPAADFQDCGTTSATASTSARKASINSVVGVADAPGSPSIDAASGQAQDQQRWTEVQAFKTQEDALRFVMECQPFDYQPVRQPKGTTGEEAEPEQQDDPFPRWESGREAMEWVMKHMSPWPSEFASNFGDFKRLLRIRQATAEEQRRQQERAAATSSSRSQARERISRRDSAASMRLRSMLPKIRASLSGIPSDSAPVQEMKGDVKPWLVESCGTLFQRVASLRDLVHESSLAKSASGGSLGAGTPRYYIAVPPQEEKQILQEGYRVQRRTSIPCSATPKEAVAAFNRHAQKRPPGAGAGAAAPGAPAAVAAASPGGASSREANAPSAKVLVVTLPPELGVDVVAHRNGGFLIRCLELPPRCFKRLNKAGGVEGA